MRSLWVGLAIAWMGCSNAATPATSPADMADAGDLAHSPTPTVAANVCRPGEKFCGQGEIRTCSADGMTSTSTTTCSGTATNPGVCAGAGGAHCELAYAACAWGTDLPWLSDGRNNGTPAPSGADWCTSTSTSSTIAFKFTHGTSSATFSAAAGGFANGQQYDISKASFTVDGCSNPSGHFTVEETLPYWNVVVETVCNSVEFAGQFWGAI